MYQNREEEIRATVSKDEAIRLIEEVYHAHYDPENDAFDVYDQLLACESVAQSNPVNNLYFKNNEKTDGNEGVSGVVNGGYRQKVDFELTADKLQVIEKLKKCNYTTSPKEVAQLLEEFFTEYQSKPGHWLYVTQNWPPRPIIRVLQQMIKLSSSGQKTIQSWARYFTYLIKFRKKRILKKITSNNDIHK